MTKAFVFDAYGTLYDVQSVAGVIHEAFPGHGEFVTQVWRLKQLEYTWLRSLMGEFEDFWSVSRASLLFTVRTLGLKLEPAVLDRILDKYLNLDPYPDAVTALRKLKEGHRLAILSNGSEKMLTDLVANTGFSDILDDTISIDAKKVFKPHRTAYELVEERLGLKPEEIIFVSSNSFDACGAKCFGFKVAWIRRAAPEALARECVEAETIAPSTMFKALRLQVEELGFKPDFTIGSLSDLSDLVDHTSAH